MMLTLTDYLSLCHQHQASDLHLSSGHPPYVRIDGRLMALALPYLTAAETENLLETALTPDQKQRLAQHRALDFDHTDDHGCRFRGHAFWQRLGLSLVFRLINADIPSLESLNAPPALATLISAQQGLILCTGPTGSGKSTTLAAMIAKINQHQHKHIISLEAPIEYQHRSGHSLINQRALQMDARDISSAVTAALRADPDVLVLGELRDLESMRQALTAAETGHLVLATLHSSSAAKTIHRILDVFPDGEKNLIRAQLAASLVAIVSQTLLPRKKPPGRLAAFEVLINTPAIAHLIREHKIIQIESVLQTQRAVGMQTLAQAIACLKKQQLI